ncbi:DedA family protein, partial [Enterobacter hormaechei]|uniref:DedA family protein n=1 Tax=Enterobacter hormaechei TaxID=158836 RepID=UPI0034D6031F
LSYWIGLHFADAVRQSRLAVRYPSMLPRGEAFFYRWGALGIVLCRFVGPLRATVPLIAGICAMPMLIFQIANWLSAFLWAAALLAPG